MNSGMSAARLIARNIVPRRNYGGGHHHRPVTMNDLPVPQGDFFARYAAQQRGHNTVLALGIIMFGSALFIVKESKIINLNYSPPATFE